MADREKVIKELEEAKEFIRTRSNGSASKICRLMDVCNAAIILLKEQEAKAPSIMQDVEGIWATCPTCGNKLRAILAMKMDTYFPKYCQECGQAVKWDG